MDAQFLLQILRDYGTTTLVVIVLVIYFVQYVFPGRHIPWVLVLRMGWLRSRMSDH
jgi:hypothetical protein